MIAWVTAHPGTMEKENRGCTPKMHTRLVVRFILSRSLCGLLIFIGASGFARANSGVLPPEAVFDGRTVGEWSVQCWKWLYSIPVDQNPREDCEGRWATNRQPPGLLFFIAPVNLFDPAATPCVRTFSIPENKFVLMPLLSATADNFASEPPLTVPQLAELWDRVLRIPSGLNASVDGVALTNLSAYRVKAPAFTFHFPTADNILAQSYDNPIVGLVDPIVTDGYWLIFEPFAPGRHVISGGGVLVLGPDDVFRHQTAANITVISVPLTKWVEDFTPVVKRSALPSKTKLALLGSLEKAQAAFASGKVRAGSQQLLAFQHKLRGMSRSTDAVLVEELNGYAERILKRAQTEL